MSEMEGAVTLGRPSISLRPLWLAIGLGLVAATLNYFYISGLRGEPVEIYKVTATLPAGSFITNAQVQGPLTIYSTEASEMRILSVDKDSFALYAKTPLAENLKPGQILFKSAFMYGAGTGISNLIPADEEAIAIPVDKAHSVGGAVRPGDLVNIYARTGTDNSAGAGNSQDPLIPSAHVLAVDADHYIPSDSGSRDREYSTVTISAKSGQIHALFSLMQSNVKPYLTLIASPPK